MFIRAYLWLFLSVFSVTPWCKLTRCSLLLSVLCLVGCNHSDSFRADELERVSRQLVPEHCQQIDAVLAELFGTPDQPQVPEALRDLVDAEGVKQAAGPVVSHTPGVTQGLYRRHCARCHGVTGDGYGPTALYQNPYPRDFRRGIIKFKSTPRGVPPTDEDLHEVLQRGVPGTAMPSFNLLTADERHSLVEYVKYLALRGQMERALVDYVAMELDFDPATGEIEEGSRITLEDQADQELVFEELLPEIADRWMTRLAVDEVSPPEDWIGYDHVIEALEEEERYEARESRNYAGLSLFLDSKRTNCRECHKSATAKVALLKDMDDWNKRRADFLQQTESLKSQANRIGADRTEQLEEQIEKRDAVGKVLLPPRFAEARRIFYDPLRGGRLPADIYRLLKHGIDGSPMPGVGNSLSEEELWKLVSFVCDSVDNAEVNE